MIKRTIKHSTVKSSITVEQAMEAARLAALEMRKRRQSRARRQHSATVAKARASKKQ